MLICICICITIGQHGLLSKSRKKSLYYIMQTAFFKPSLPPLSKLGSMWLYVRACRGQCLNSNWNLDRWSLLTLPDACPDDLSEYALHNVPNIDVRGGWLLSVCHNGGPHYDAVFFVVFGVFFFLFFKSTELYLIYLSEPHGCLLNGHYRTFA